VWRWGCALLVIAAVLPGEVRSQPLSQRFLLAGQKKTRGEVVSTTPLPAIARIIVPEKDGVSYGSGSLIDVRDDYGLVVTNWHVVRDASGAISVLFPDGFSSRAEVVKVDKDWDLAALSIRKPSAAPLSMTAVPPQPGQKLFIAGYGSGDFRAAAGNCLGYGAPGEGLPQELVEVDAEARNGDSGGPILTERGEIAGVLFGTNGTTHGSYGGRVIEFLTSVLPGGTFAKTSPLPVNTIPTKSTSPFPPAESSAGISAGSAVSQDSAFNITEPEFGQQLSAMAGNPSRQSGQPPNAAPADADAGLVPIPTRRGPTKERSEPAGNATAEVGNQTDLENRLASAGGATSLAPSGSLGASSFSADAAPVPSRKGGAKPAVQTADDSTLQLVGEVWKRIGGESPWDQAKAVLAGIGLLALFVLFWRMNSAPEPAVQEE
jgi:hypothetical protein